MGNIKYKLAKFKNSGSAYNNFYYPRAVIIGRRGTNELAELIQERCTLTRADVKACLEALSAVMRESLENSFSVRLDGLGIFKVGIQTKEMVEDIKDFNVNTCIKGYRINFLPEYAKDASGKHIRTILKNTGFSAMDEYAEGVNATKKVGGKYVKVDLVEKV